GGAGGAAGRAAGPPPPRGGPGRAGGGVGGGRAPLPLVQTSFCVHALLSLQLVPLGFAMQSSVQQEPAVPLAAPSSHCSPNSTMPFPQDAAAGSNRTSSSSKLKLKPMSLRASDSSTRVIPSERSIPMKPHTPAALWQELPEVRVSVSNRPLLPNACIVIWGPNEVSHSIPTRNCGVVNSICNGLPRGLPSCWVFLQRSPVSRSMRCSSSQRIIHALGRHAAAVERVAKVGAERVTRVQLIRGRRTNHEPPHGGMDLPPAGGHSRCGREP